MTIRAPRLAGVRVGRNGPLIFVRAGDAEIQAGDAVTVRLNDGREAQATVTVAPGQLLNPAGTRPVGEIVSA